MQKLQETRDETLFKAVEVRWNCKYPLRLCIKFEQHKTLIFINKIWDLITIYYSILKSQLLLSSIEIWWGNELNHFNFKYYSLIFSSTPLFTFTFILFNIFPKNWKCLYLVSLIKYLYYYLKFLHSFISRF